MPPTFETPRLRLRPTALADVDALWTLWTTPAVRRYLWDDRVITPEDAAATVADCIALGPAGLGLWVVEARDARDTRDAGLLGCAGLLPVREASAYDPRLAGLVEPLVALAPGAWGRGYAHEALAALLGYAVGTLGLARLAAVTDVPNAASDRMLRRAGFRVLGEVPGPRHRLRTYLWEPPAAGHAPTG